MNIEECFYLGYTSKVHGKQGELIAKLDVDSPEKYKKLESVLIRVHKLDNVLIPFFITSAQVLNNGTIKFKIDGVDSLDSAKELIGKELYLPLTQLPKLTGNKFYYHEVVGFTVVDEIKGELGIIKEILDYPTQAIIEITHPSQKEILIPITDQVIKNVNKEEQLIEVIAPEGLIELYLD
tara:strand:+ start:2803 stop:3342 length:540 start_codon:yes stop_codon:yes gene_type:complete